MPKTSSSLQMILWIFIASFLPIHSTHAAETLTYPRQVHNVLPKVSREDKAINFGVVYLTQWAVYSATQHETIEKHGSFENWRTNPFKAHFDKDHFDYNLVKHTFTGQYYYLFYRSRGYTEKAAFIWSTISSLAFEFTIETVTEQPSYQDIYQTPVYGTLVGMAFENLSSYFHSLNTTPTSVLGYIFNPFSLLPGSKFEIQMAPVILNDHQGVEISLRF